MKGNIEASPASSEQKHTLRFLKGKQQHRGKVKILKKRGKSTLLSRHVPGITCLTAGNRPVDPSLAFLDRCSSTTLLVSVIE
jgi:hypothetical protein